MSPELLENTKIENKHVKNHEKSNFQIKEEKLLRLKIERKKYHSFGKN
jgi:hypothetical protein